MHGKAARTTAMPSSSRWRAPALERCGWGGRGGCAVSDGRMRWERDTRCTLRAARATEAGGRAD